MALLEYPIDTEIAPMRILRIPLMQALQEHPDNMHLLVKFAKLESRYSENILTRDINSKI